MKRLILLTVLIVFLSGCVFTKVVTVPMRVTGAVVSVIPVVGDGVNNVLDTSADVIDAIPI
jgi:PBP1b-binding outer membrane lipoprotein LpoB